MRKQALLNTEEIEQVSIPIQNFESFSAKMQNKGYELSAETFFIKHFQDDIELNITYREQMIKAITCYQQDNLIPIPENLKQESMADIQECNS